VISDLGTYAGIKTDANARALDADGQVIAGLYAAGNDMAEHHGRQLSRCRDHARPGADFRLYRRQTSGACEFINPSISALAVEIDGMANAVKSPHHRWMVGRLGSTSAVQK
jgi:FAD binding domain